MRKVKIKKAPLINGYNQIAPSYMPNSLSEKDMEVRKTLTPIDRKFANIEAEKGETLYDLDVDGLPAHYNIEGKKHTQGGTPLSTNDHSFIFSADKNLKIKDPYLLAEFGKLVKKDKTKQGGELPADLAKQYDINKYRKILADPNSDKLERETAEQMIKNYNLKLSKLALVQESMKGFPDGIPDAGLAYIAMAGINPQELLPIDVTKTAPQSSMKMSTGMPKAPEGGDTKKKPTLPKDAIVLNEVADEDEDALNARIDEAWKSNPNKPIYVIRKGQYVPLVTRTGSLVTTSKSGMEGYSNFGNYEEDLKKGNDLFQKMVDNNLAYYDDKAKGWKIRGTAATSDLLTLEDRDVLTRLANSSGEGLGWEGKPIILQHGKDNPYGMYGWANPDILEYKYWKSNNQGKGDSKTFENMSDDERKQNRIDMINFYMKNDKFNPGFKGAEEEYGDLLSNPDKLYSSGSPLMKGDFNLVSGIQTIFGEEGSYYPGEGKDYKIGTEHLKEFRKERPWELGDPLEEEKVSGEIPVQKLEIPATQEAPAPWWIQDTTEIFGRAGDFATIKKYLPWAPKLHPDLMEPTFYDPTRELGQQKEDAAMAYEATKAFGQGPQALGARISAIQGAGAKAAADTLSKYNNLNVGVDNQTKQINTGILNQFGMANAQLSQDLYDKTTIANQQYDNAKREAATALREAFKTGLTNRAKAQALNTLYPNYQVDPTTGGFVTFTPDPNKKLKPSSGYTNPNFQAYLDAVNSNPDVDPSTIAKFFGVDSNLQKDYDINPDAEYLNMYNVVTPGNYP